MSQPLIDLLRDRSTPLAPAPTGETPRLTTMPGLKAVLFDVYGTLVVSGSGDVGTASPEGRGAAFVGALAAVGLPFDGDGGRGVNMLVAVIKGHHADAKARGVDYPEVDIRAVWRDVLGELSLPTLDDATVDRLAVEYECRTNPVWPMPGAAGVLDELRGRGLRPGIVSNAQFFTPLLFPALLGRSLTEFGFAEESRTWSWEHLRAKPGMYLYELAAGELARHGIEPGETLYVGNDLLNDVTPAAAVGFRTALFAGDARSLRWRGGDERVAGVRPDAVITELSQLIDCVGAGG